MHNGVRDAGKPVSRTFFMFRRQLIIKEMEE